MIITLFSALNRQVNRVVNMIIADRCEKMSLINLAVLFCKMDLPLSVNRG